MSRPVPGRAAAHRGITVVVLALTAVATLLGAPAAASAVTTSPIRSPRTPAGLPTAIEGLARYVPQVSCDPRIGAGTRSLATLLVDTYRVSVPTTWASAYPCGTDGTPSEHYDGRAIDWLVDVRNPGQRAAANATIAWLLATDAQGNPFAMARRLGVMYLIYDNRMWGAWDGRWANYNGCQAPARQQPAFANSCHRTHVHISLSWAGAQGRTSFWTRQVAAEDYGPCRAADLNVGPRYARPNPTGCPRYPPVNAARGASALTKALVPWSGAWLGRASSGPAVTAVQRAFHLTPSSTYGSRTAAVVARFQRAHHLPATGAMNQNTWRALLAAVR